MAVSCDAIQVYRGLETLSGAATPRERSRLEHRLVGFVDLERRVQRGAVRRASRMPRSTRSSPRAGGRSWWAGPGFTFARRSPTSSFDRPSRPSSAARSRPRSPPAGPEVLHAELDPDVAATVHPRDRKRVARALELQRAGIAPPQGSEQLWTAGLRRPTVLVGLTVDREELGRRIEARVEEMVAAGAAEEARRAVEAGASRTARAGARLRGAAGRRSGGGEARPPRLRAPPAHLDAEDAGRGADRPHRPRRPSVAEEIVAGLATESRGGRAGDRIASRRCGSRSGRRSATTT